MAGWGKLVGFDLWRLRLLNVAISYGAALALLRLLRRTTSLGELPAFALTLAFALSPYFFGASFTLLTDNLAILFALLALERMHALHAGGLAGRVRASPACGRGGGGAHAPVVPLARARWRRVFLVLRERRSPARLFARRRAAGARARPAGGARDRVERARAAERGPGLVRALHRQARASAATRSRCARSASRSRCSGVYAVAVLGPGAGAPRAARRLARWSAPGSAVGVALVLISPLEYRPVGAQARATPATCGRSPSTCRPCSGSSLLFWAAVPLGAAAAALLARRAGWTSLPSVYLGLLPGGRRCPVALVYQKYFDPFALLAVALFARPPDFRVRWDYAGRGGWCARARWPTRSASRERLAGLTDTASTTKTSVSFGRDRRRVALGAVGELGRDREHPPAALAHARRAPCPSP